MSAHELLEMLEDPARLALIESMGWNLKEMRTEYEKAITNTMTCTCAKRLLPCPVHGDNHLPFCEAVRVKAYVINVYETWPAISTFVQDKRYYTTVSEDALRVFQSSESYDRNAAFEKAVDFLETERKAKE